MAVKQEIETIYLPFRPFRTVRIRRVSPTGSRAIALRVERIFHLRAFASSREASRKPPVREISHEVSMMAGR